MASDIVVRESRNVKQPPRGRQSFRFGLLFLRSHAREWFVLLCVVVGVALSSAYISQTPTKYRASAQIFVTTKQTTGGAQAAGQSFVQSQMQSYASIVTSSLVLDPVAENKNLGPGGGSLGVVSADAPLDQSLLNVHAESASAVRAADVANAVAAQTIAVIEQLQTSAVQLTIIHNATPPSTPIAPRKNLILVVGLLGGLVVGLILVLSLERATQRIRSPRDVEATTDVPLLGIIPDAGSARMAAISSSRGGPSSRGEAFSQLRSSLQFVDVDHPPKVLAIASGRAGEGRTSVALNLARELAAVELTVCLVEADLRRPSLAGRLSIDSGTGLTTLLLGDATGTRAKLAARAGESRPLPFDREDAQPGSTERSGGVTATPARPTGVETVVEENLTVIPAGPIPPNPGNLLASRQFRRVIAELRERFDYVIVDTASLLAVVDGAEVIAAADAALLVVRARSTTRRQLSASLRAVDRVDGSVAGVVLYRTLRASMRGSGSRRGRGRRS